MSRVHCLECRAQVVVDPRGLCPEGHEVGTVGSRVEQAMGHQAAHPDEPQPWVYRIDPDELDPTNGRRSGSKLRAATNAVAANGSGPARDARPVPVPGMSTEGFDDEPADAESLLRELHSLAALDSALAAEPGRGTTNGQHRSSPAGPTPTPGSPPPPPPVATTPPRPPRGDPSAIADAFAELNALDVPRTATNGAHRAPTTPEPAPTGAATPRHGGEAAKAAEAAADELSSLFDDPPLFTRTDPDDDAGASRAAPAVAAEADRSPPPVIRSRSGTDHTAQHDDTAGLELQAMFETAGSSAAADDQRPAPARSPDDRADASGPEQGPGPRTAAHPPSPQPPPDEHPGGQATATPAPAPPTPAPPGAGLDLTSFTAKGGSGSGRGAGRRRRFGR